MSEMTDFLKWADDKIIVRWTKGTPAYESQPLEFFAPDSDEDVLDFLNRVVDWVRVEVQRNHVEGDEYVFHLKEEVSGKVEEECDDYSEESFTPMELLEIFHEAPRIGLAQIVGIICRRNCGGLFESFFDRALKNKNDDDDDDVCISFFPERKQDEDVKKIPDEVVDAFYEQIRTYLKMKA